MEWKSDSLGKYSLASYSSRTVGCRKVSEQYLVGKLVYEIDLPEDKTELKDVTEVTVEFFEDKTFEIKDMPAVIMGYLFCGDYLLQSDLCC